MTDYLKKVDGDYLLKVDGDKIELANQAGEPPPGVVVLRRRIEGN